MKDVEPIVVAGADAVREVLNRPKNLAKGPFPKDLVELYKLAGDEMGELWDELEPPRDNLDAIIAEAADACAYLFAIIAECKTRKELDKQMR